MKRFICIWTVLSLILGPVSADSLNNSFENSGNLTDQEAKDAKNFVHQGLRDRTIREKCQAEGLDTCSQGDVDKQGAVLDGNFGQAVEQNIGKLYGVLFGGMSLMGGGGGGGVKVVSKADQKAFQDAGNKYMKDGKEVKKKDAAEEKSDYCIYAAMGYEVLSGYIQQGMQAKIEESLKEEQDIQLKSLVALQKTHEARRKTSLYQGTVYAATSACYIARAATSQGRVVMDWKYWLKMSGAAALSTLFYVKAKKHRLAAEAVGRVIEKLPKTGACNPWTGTTCFCAEKTSKDTYPENYQQVCVLQKGETDPNNVAVGCGVMKDGKMSYDKNCECKTTHSCFIPKFTSTNTQLGLGSNMMKMSNLGFDLIGNGNLDSARLDSYGTLHGANAAKIKEKIAVTNMPSLQLTPKEKQIADAFSSLMPPQAASALAQAPSLSAMGAGFGDGGIQSAMDKLPKNLKDKVSETEPVKYTSGSGYSHASETEEEGFVMPGTEQASSGGTEVMNFTEKAMENADVTNSPDTPIFDIISNRYMRSGLNKLQIPEEKK